MADFSNYELTSGLNVYDLADSLIPEVAKAAGFELSEAPEASNLGQLVGRLGPDKELQANISVVREALGGDYSQKIADWVERSGIMYPVERSFVSDVKTPERTDFVVWGGGVANWILRRAAMTQRLDPSTVGKVLLPVGQREMKPAEHQLVTKLIGHDTTPTEAAFISEYVEPDLKRAGFDVETVEIADTNGDKILKEFLKASPEVLEGTVIVVSNAPNAIQAAGQLRVAAIEADSTFDSNGDQLFMVSDSFPVARRGEAAKTHQNPETALGQLGRNALFLQRNMPAA